MAYQTHKRTSRGKAQTIERRAQRARKTSSFGNVTIKRKGK